MVDSVPRFLPHLRYQPLDATFLGSLPFKTNIPIVLFPFESNILTVGVVRRRSLVCVEAMLLCCIK